MKTKTNYRLKTIKKRQSKKDTKLLQTKNNLKQTQNNYKLKTI